MNVRLVRITNPYVRCVMATMPKNDLHSSRLLPDTRAACQRQSQWHGTRGGGLGPQPNRTHKHNPQAQLDKLCHNRATPPFVLRTGGGPRATTSINLFDSLVSLGQTSPE